MKDFKTNKVVFYEVNSRYFKDSTGNGIGDFNGFAENFDYFNHLGVDALIMQDVLSVDSYEKTPSFLKLATELGSLTSFKKILASAKKSEIRVLIELRLGSISETNEWFKEALEDTKEFSGVVDLVQNKVSENLNYKFSSDSQKYYLVHPETQEVLLNWKSESVLINFIKVIRYWIEQGVNGFVFKDFEFLADIERKNAMSDITLRELRKFYRAIKEIDDSVIIVGKTDILPHNHSKNFTEGPTKVFDYFMTTEMSRLGLDKKFGADAIGKFSCSKLVSILKNLASDPKNILTFNSKYIGKVVSRWADDGQYRDESSKALAILLLLSKAASSIYSGDEIGLVNIGLTHLDDFQDNSINERKRFCLEKGLKEKEFMNAQVLQNPINARALMAWNDGKNGGFSTAEKTITPVNVNYKAINVRNEFLDKNSTLNFYRNLLKNIKDGLISEVMNNGVYSISSPLFSKLIKVNIKNRDNELIAFINLSNGSRNIKVPMGYHAIVSSWTQKGYEEKIERLDAYEAIIVAQNAKGYALPSRPKPVRPKDEIQPVMNKKEHHPVKDLEEKVKQGIKTEIEMSHLHLKKENNDIVSKDATHNQNLENQIQKMKNLRESERSFKDEQTNLKEDELAKTTLLDSSISLDELLEKDAKKKK